MAVCDGCQQEKQKTFRCSRCRSTQYCSKDCQVAAWRQHKQNCIPKAVDAAKPAAATQHAVLLGEGLDFGSGISIPKAPVSIAVVRHYFSKRKSSKDSDFIDTLMPFSERLFKRPMRMIFDQRAANRLQMNQIAIRDYGNLQNGIGPVIRGQALVYDPTGKDIPMADYLCFDDQVCNLVQERFPDFNGAPTKVQLDKLSKLCQDSYECQRPQYTETGCGMGIEEEDEEDEWQT